MAVMKGVRVFLAGVAVLVVAAGCGAAAAPVLRIVLKIGASIAIEAGSEYVQQMVNKDAATDLPKITVEFTNANNDAAAVTYAVRIDDAISVRRVDGTVTITGDGKNATVAVAPGTSATIGIVPGGRAGPQLKSSAEGTDMRIDAGSLSVGKNDCLAVDGKLLTKVQCDSGSAQWKIVDRFDVTIEGDPANFAVGTCEQGGAYTHWYFYNSQVNTDDLVLCLAEV